MPAQHPYIRDLSEGTRRSTPITQMDKATLRRVILAMFEELRDQVLPCTTIKEDRDNVKFLRWTARDKPVPKYSFQFAPLLVSYDVNGGLPEDSWDDINLERLYRGLTDSLVQVEVLNKDMDPITIGTPLQFLKTCGKKLRVYETLKNRLISTIETTIGHPIVPRSQKAIDPRLNDPLPPNSYVWQFSEQYPGFPDVKGGVSRWSAEIMNQCHKALDDGHLVVVNLASEPRPPDNVDTEEDETSKAPSGMIAESPTDEGDDIRSIGEAASGSELGEASRASSESELLQDEEPDVLPNSHEQDDLGAPPNLHRFHTTFKRELSEINAKAKNAHEVVGSFVQLHAQMYEETLSVALGVYTHEQKAAWKTRHMLQKQRLRARIEELGSELDSKSIELETALQHCSALNSIIESLDLQLAAAATNAAGNMEEIKAEAKRQGEAEGRRKALEDLNTSTEREHIALRRSHMERLGEVRASSFEEGFVTRSQQLQAGTPCPVSQIGSLELTSIGPNGSKLDQKQAIVAAMEHGRREGREHAYQELALSQGDRVDAFLQSHSDLKKNRKVRELKTIHQNWQDVPQRILPTYMLPQGHTPGDKTLYLLPKLSKELDATSVINLLTDEIGRRCKDVSCDGNSNSRIVANADIHNVLNKINSANRTVSVDSDLPDFCDSRDKIIESVAQPTTIKTEMSIRTCFQPALNFWLKTDSSDHLTDGYKQREKTEAKWTLSTKEMEQLEDRIAQHCTSANMAVKDYREASAVEYAQLKRYIAGLTLGLSSDFKLPPIDIYEDAVDIMMDVCSIFLRSGQMSRSKSMPFQANHRSPPLVLKSCLKKQPQPPQTSPVVLLPQKRQPDEDTFSQPKRTKLSAIESTHQSPYQGAPLQAV